MQGTLYRYYSWQAVTETFNYPCCLHHELLWSLIRSARWKQAASKSCPEWTSNDVSSHECQVLASVNRLLSTLSLSLSLFPSPAHSHYPHQLCASMTGDLRERSRDPWVANQVLGRASTAAAPSSFVPHCVFWRAEEWRTNYEAT